MKLAETTPTDSLRWLESLTTAEPGKTATGFSQVLGQWSRSDSAAAGVWLQTHAANLAYDQMAGAYAETVCREDVANALAWVGSIRDSSQREEGLVKVAREVIKAQGEDGKTALRAAGIADDVIQNATRKDQMVSLFLGDQVNRYTGSVWTGNEHGQLVRWISERHGHYSADVADTKTEHFELAFSAVPSADELVLDANFSPTQNLGPHPPGFASKNCSSCHAGN
ncbi:MAG: hypothetical protein ACR2OZ_20515 [Verrucomicrobiales bacterium]